MRKEKYTQEQMDEQFSRVQNKRDWKMPINCRVKLREQDIDVLYNAIIYFTGSVPMIKETKNFGEYHVRAEGYYNAIGA